MILNDLTRRPFELYLGLRAMCKHTYIMETRSTSPIIYDYFILLHPELAFINPYRQVLGLWFYVCQKSFFNYTSPVKIVLLNSLFICSGLLTYIK